MAENFRESQPSPEDEPGKEKLLKVRKVEYLLGILNSTIEDIEENVKVDLNIKSTKFGSDVQNQREELYYLKYWVKKYFEYLPSDLKEEALGLMAQADIYLVDDKAKPKKR